jgi:hypothetical protein
MFDRVIDDLLRGLLVGEIADDFDRLAAEFAYCLSRMVRLADRASVACNVRPRFSQSYRDGSPETGGSARNERFFTIEPELVEDHI